VSYKSRSCVQRKAQQRRFNAFPVLRALLFSRRPDELVPHRKSRVLFKKAQRRRFYSVLALRALPFSLGRNKRVPHRKYRVEEEAQRRRFDAFPALRALLSSTAKRGLHCGLSFSQWLSEAGRREILQELSLEPPSASQELQSIELLIQPSELLTSYS
jgi:hypothetical protein